jgi:hypothetical protein
MDVTAGRQPTTLAGDQLSFYGEHGFVRVTQAFCAKVALELTEIIWRELKDEYQIDRNDRASWRQPSRAPKLAKSSPLNTKVPGPRFIGVISDLLGREDWPRPKDWGGFLLTFPQVGGCVWDVPTDTWHWDGGESMEGPFIFSFYSEVRPGGGGTLLLSGSHHLLRQFYHSLSPEERNLPHKQHRRMFSKWDPWLADLTGVADNPTHDRIGKFMEKPTEVRGVNVQVVELCGDPGDAFFCTPLLLHAIAPNCSMHPRIMRSKFFFS